MAALLEDSDADRLQRMRHHAGFLKERPPARRRHGVRGHRRPLDLQLR
ncbi:MAG: hypothetical protein M3O70_02375 [Actinomycetota bacterium]|nr:hypothetical protein [Actinomycetota bacterium]